MAVGLHEKLVGKCLKSIQINQKSRYAKVGGIEKVERIPFPLRIARIYAKGKKVIFECSTFVDGFNLYLLSTLAMSGRWQYEEGKHSGIELVFDDCSAFFEDQRHFGSLVICFGEEELKLSLKAVGPDLLSDEISFEDYNQVISNKRIRSKQICSFLLEQKYFSGIGNWVRAEVLYESGIAPFRTLESLSLEEKKLLHYNSVKILREAYTKKGLTITNYISPNGEYGTYDVKVYMKDKDPEGNDIVRETFSDKRTMHWVPVKQK